MLSKAPTSITTLTTGCDACGAGEHHTTTVWNWLWGWVPHWNAHSAVVVHHGHVTHEAGQCSMKHAHCPTEGVCSMKHEHCVLHIHPRPTLSADDARCLLEKALAAAENVDSVLHVGCDGKPLKAQVSVAVYVPDRSRDNSGHYYTLDNTRTMQAALIGAKAKAYTAGAHSSDSNAMTSGLFGRVTAPGALWSGEEHATDPGRSNNSRVAGGIPLYVDGALVGALGVDGDAPHICERIAFDAVVERYQAPKHLQKASEDLAASL